MGFLLSLPSLKHISHRVLGQCIITCGIPGYLGSPGEETSPVCQIFNCIMDLVVRQSVLLSKLGVLTHLIPAHSSRAAVTLHLSVVTLGDASGQL